MARLTAVCRTEDYEFERRQIGLAVDDNLTMVVQFRETCDDCKNLCGVKQKDLEWFVQRFNLLTKDEMAVAMMVTSKDIFHSLSQLVPCVGCRRSVERLFNQLVESGHPAVDPLVITSSGILSVSHNYLFDPRAMFALFHIHGAKFSSVIDSLPKSKKTKRCNLHSLDTHKAKPTGRGWLEIWEIMSTECKEEIVLIDTDSLLDTLATYLRKHRFCTECKAKVMKAYNLLVGDLDPAQEKGYRPDLYSDLRFCSQERHIHVLCDTQAITDLIERAEPEILSRNVDSRRDRHAKTIDIAQEEVLTCLGIHIYERLHRVGQKLRSEEQTWQILFYLGVDALKKNYELALEKKQGVSNLELMCKELLEEERAKELKREQKRQKRKKKRSKQNDSQLETCIETIKAEIVCKCDKVMEKMETPVSPRCPPVCQEDPNSNTKLSSAQSCGYVRGPPIVKGVSQLIFGSRSSDAGYSSGMDAWDSCSLHSSNDSSEVTCSHDPCPHDSSEVTCSDDLCPHDDCDSCSCSGDSFVTVCKSCADSDDTCTKGKGRSRNDKLIGSDECCNGVLLNHQCGRLSLQDMLEEPCYSDDEEFISEEDIRTFKANQHQVLQQRQELRQTLRQRFDSMQQRRTDSQPSPGHNVDFDKLAQRLLGL